jgi:hypothetical protein
MTDWKKIKWDSIVVTLVDHKLRDPLAFNIVPIDYNFEVEQVDNMLERRSPEEFRIYIRELFNNRTPNFSYHWYFSILRNRS